MSLTCMTPQVGFNKYKNRKEKDKNMHLKAHSLKVELACNYISDERKGLRYEKMA